jgi:predicted flap endonuclease-1-like 5' DNA nuclease
MVKSPKAVSADVCQALEQLPNIGPSLAADLRRLGIRHPAELKNRDPFQLYQALCRARG